MQTFRPYYFPGQTVRGEAIIDLFNPIKKKSVIIRVKGKELPGKYGSSIAKRMVNKPDTFKRTSTNESPYHKHKPPSSNQL